MNSPLPIDNAPWRRTTTAAGVELAYTVAGAQPSGDAAPLQIHAGLLSTDLHWRAFIAHYQRRHPVLVWDYPGHGRSPAPRDLGAVGIGAFADEGHHVLGEARRSDGLVGAAIVCGLSMGVQVALEHYRRYPDDVRALVLLCGTYGHPLDRISPSAAFRKTMAALVRGAARGRRLFHAALWPIMQTPLGHELAYLTGGAHRDHCPPAVLDELYRHVAGMEWRVVVEECASYLEHTAEDVLAEVRMPTMILAGGADQLTPPSVSEKMQRLIPGAALHVVAGQTHLALVEQPDEVHRVVDEFLARIAC